MTEEYGILDGRLTALEARLTGNVVEPTIGATHAEAGQPFTERNDPKGRKPWEAYWDADNHSMMIFVPSGALIAGGSAVEVSSGEAQQEGESFKVGAGDWSLQVEKTESGWTAKLESSEGESGEGKWNIKIAKIVGDEGDEVAEQYASSVIVIDEGDKLEEPEAVAESVEEDEEPEVEVEVVKASEEKPKHLKFSFKIPKGKEGEKGQGVEEIKMVQKGEGGKYLPWYLQFFKKKGDTTPISELEFLTVRGDDGELFIGGVDTGISVKGEKGDPGPMPEGMGIKKLSFAYGDETPVETEFVAKNGVTIRQKKLIEGNGIRLTQVTDGIRIESTAEGAAQGEIVYVYDVKYDIEAHMLMKLMAQTNLRTGTTTYGTERAATAAAGIWEPFSGGAETVPYT